MKSYHNRIHINPAIMLGKPVIKGTRIPVELIVRKIGEGALTEDLLDAYPNITKEDIQAAVLYAADNLANEVDIFLETGT
ncbi:MAG: DUF433 domain-containing protein [Deltaproteobacteria bacterium]|nr:DUF433 domain-containing protein [Deltaproteobacteria bacterium]